MNNQVLVTGANGQLGNEIKKLLPHAIFTDVHTLDVTDLDAVRKFVDDNSVDVIVNCAAYTAVDRAESEFELAKKVNEIGPRNLALSGAKIVHISTDYVFDGRSYRPYLPEDETNPISVYGCTKRNGEIAVLENAEVAIIIRTAWLYSAYGNNFVKTMRKLGAERESVNVVADQVGSPTFAGDLAQAIVKILPVINAKNKGIYHYTNEGVCSWYDFATEIMELFGLVCKVNPVPSSAYPTKAVRPFYSVLSKEKIKKVFDIEISHWKTSLRKFCKENG